MLPAEFEVDHERALADGGTNDPSNLVPLCTPCHRVKTARESDARTKAKSLQRDNEALNAAELFGRNLMSLFIVGNTTKWYHGCVIGIEKGQIRILYEDGDEVLTSYAATKDRARFKWVL